MKEKKILTSPRIFYELETVNNHCNLSVYLEGFADSKDPEVCCKIEDFTEDTQKAVRFIENISHACALPVHIPELAEEFLSV